MKQSLRNTIVSCMTATAMAGPTQEMVPAPAPTAPLGGWFVGGSYGQINDADNIISTVGGLIGLIGGYGGIGNPGGLLPDVDDIEIGDLDFDLYSLHVGRKLNDQFLGCDTSVYFEIAYLDGGLNISSYSAQLEEDVSLGIDLDIIPVTVNLKLERQLFGNLSAYASAGLGFAYTEASMSGMGQNMSSDDIEFYSQISFGLTYHVTEKWDVFGGLRWMNLSNMDFGTEIPLELVDDQFAWEFGARYNF